MSLLFLPKAFNFTFRCFGDVLQITFVIIQNFANRIPLIYPNELVIVKQMIDTERGTAAQVALMGMPPIQLRDLVPLFKRFTKYNAYLT
jgi:hypothetical protein